MGLLYQLGYFVTSSLAHCCFDFRVIGREKIPKEGGLLLAMNHQSFLDPPLGGMACDREVFYLARKSLLDWPLVGGLLPKVNVIPFDQEGSDRSAVKTVIRVVREGNPTLIFPEGTRSRDGKIQPGQAGIGMIVAKTLAPVVPMRIFGAFEAFPRGGRQLRFSPIRVVVGDVLRFDASDFAGATKSAYARVSERVMAGISAIELPGR
jgi:1-acyl-sn-glycerol-3-phosphate acyltransferase